MEGLRLGLLKTCARHRLKRDAILGHVASWGDRWPPCGAINRLPLVLSTPQIIRVTPKRTEVPDEFSEGSFVNSPKQLETKPSSDEHPRQPHHEEFNRTDRDGSSSLQATARSSERSRPQPAEGSRLADRHLPEHDRCTAEDRNLPQLATRGGVERSAPAEEPRVVTAANRRGTDLKPCRRYDHSSARRFAVPPPLIDKLKTLALALPMGKAISP